MPFLSFALTTFKMPTTLSSVWPTVKEVRGRNDQIDVATSAESNDTDEEIRTNEFVILLGARYEDEHVTNSSVSDDTSRAEGTGVSLDPLRANKEKHGILPI